MNELKLFDALTYGLILFIAVGFIGAWWLTKGKDV